MKRLEGTPKADGFRMPGEFERHQGCYIIWPERPDNWRLGGKPAQEVFTTVANTIGKYEPMTVVVSRNQYSNARNMLADYVKVVEMSNDDSWIRDCGATFVINDKGEMRGVDWVFNAWGGLVDGLYFPWDQDDKIAQKMCELEQVDSYRLEDFVLEGGSIHVDGEGTVMVTEECLLSEGRNPHMTKEQIGEKLCEYLGCEKVLWIPNGIYNDETNEHVDNVCAFVGPAEVVLAWTDDENDPQYPLSKACYDYLSSETDAKGRKITIHKLPIPKTPVCVSEEDMEGYVFEEGEDVREIGERLAASYVNFYFSNNSVILPQFSGENEESDRLAVSIMEKVCKGRKIVPIKARNIIVGGGNIHCITQQIPKGALK